MPLLLCRKLDDFNVTLYRISYRIPSSARLAVIAGDKNICGVYHISVALHHAGRGILLAYDRNLIAIGQNCVVAPSVGF